MLLADDVVAVLVNAVIVDWSLAIASSFVFLKSLPNESIFALTFVIVTSFVLTAWCVLATFITCPITYLSCVFGSSLPSVWPEQNFLTSPVSVLAFSFATATIAPLTARPRKLVLSLQHEGPSRRSRIFSCIMILENASSNCLLHSA